MYIVFLSVFLSFLSFFSFIIFLNSSPKSHSNILYLVEMNLLTRMMMMMTTVMMMTMMNEMGLKKVNIQV